MSYTFVQMDSISIPRVNPGYKGLHLGDDGDDDDDCDNDG